MANTPIIFDDPAAEALLDAITAQASTNGRDDLPFREEVGVVRTAECDAYMRGIRDVVRALRAMGAVETDPDILAHRLSRVVLDEAFNDQF